MPITFDELILASGGIQSTAVIVGANGATITGTVTATLFSGPVTGGVTGNVTGNVVGGASLAPQSGDTQTLSGDGAISILRGAVIITKGSIAAITIAPPTAGTDDFKFIFISSQTAFAHVITQGTVGFNNKGASGTATFGAAKGNSFVLMAQNGNWWVFALNGVTIA